MKLSQVAAQLYTVRDHVLDPTAFARTVERLKSIGYAAVELIPSDKVKDQEIARICHDNGVAVAGTHVHESVLIAHPETIVEKLEVLGSKIGVYAYPTDIDLGSQLDVEQLASRLEQSAEVLRRAGMTLAYHNHALEFSRIAGELVLNTIRRTAPTLAFELDVYWVQYGGGNPERWIRELHGKLPTVHLKDFGFDLKKNRPFMTEVGSGNLDLPAIVAEAERAGCEWFVVEQDETPGDPFDSLERSFQYARHALASRETGA
ncbi:MAG: sugar phosphate isomerase/epimerase [Verrucomicrobia bacterium]|nr:sugar phosphate isomerase/epimerase [Verrucomicrobiota bacterium]